jgi:uncharacterized protein (DUF1800 family)
MNRTSTPNKLRPLSTMRKRTLQVVIAAGATLSLLASAAAQARTVDSIEFYNTNLKHFFRTIDPAEAAAIDKGAAGAGWVRTGQNFAVWPAAVDVPGVAVPVCRFYASGPNSHFFTADNAECRGLIDAESAFKVANPNKAFTGWTLEGTAFYALTPTNGKCGVDTKPLYRHYNNRAAQNDSNHRFVSNTAAVQDTADIMWPLEGVVMCLPGESTAARADAARMLRQATFGATATEMANIEKIGINDWLEQQFLKPASNYPDLPFTAYVQPDTCKSNGALPATDPQNICARDSYSLFPVQMAFLKNALTADDQLRQRVAFALSQIFVVSGAEINHAYGMSRYQQIMIDNAFGNYRNLLQQVTLSPAMGRYLDMANSNKPDPAKGISANENYGREILQLFSVGLNELNMDGTLKRDAAGAPIPTYTQERVENFARVFTGWTYATFQNFAPPARNNGVYYEYPMLPVESNHDTGAKTLFAGKVLPAGQTATKDLNDALDNIFNHPNVGPFISRALIQKLTGGDPAPAYVARVAAVFNNNGQGVRGDLKAVVRAILLDPEVRGEVKTAAKYGKLKEPVLFMTSLARGLGGKNDGVYFRGQLAALGQSLFNSPTVFNYFSPEHQISNGAIGPEFEIQNATTSFNRANFLNAMLMGNGFAPDTSVDNSVGTYIDWAPWQALAATPAALVDKLNWTFAHGTLSTTAQKIISDAVTAVVATDTLMRAKTAAYLTLNAAQVQVER